METTSKESKFNKIFSSVVDFDNEILVLSAELYSLEEAIKMFNDEIEERKTWSWGLIPKGDVYSTFVKARYNFEEENTWWWIDFPEKLTNFHKPVWVLDVMQNRNNKDSFNPCQSI